MYLNSVQIIGFVGKDPERRQARSNGAAFTVLSVATQRSWKNADDEWASKTEWHRVIAWNSLGERVAASLRQGDHILVEGTLVSSSYDHEGENGLRIHPTESPALKPHSGASFLPPEQFLQS